MGTIAQSFGHASAMPAPTWHFLDMNDTVIEIPQGLPTDASVGVDMPWTARGAEGEFECAMDEAQRRWEVEHPEPSPEEIAYEEECLKAEADATYGGTALSEYQSGAAAVEKRRSLLASFDHGVGGEAAAYLRYAAGRRIVILADPGEAVDARVVVDGVPGAMNVAAVDVVSGEGATVNLSVVVAGSAPDEGGAIAGTTVRVFADVDAEVNVARVQALPEGFVDIDDMGLFAAERSKVSVRQGVYGAGRSFTGLACDLRGDDSRIEIETRYLGQGEQVRDFNYAVRHHGVRTESALKANGVLAGSSEKTLRGTIDLIRGCKGARGNENETVLLVDEGVRNKTVPVILCNEDDVAGNHGATIGHVRDEQLFYLESRGLSREDAERMFVSALVEQAAIEASDETARKAIVRLGESSVPGFADLFE